MQWQRSSRRFMLIILVGLLIGQPVAWGQQPRAGHPDRGAGRQSRISMSSMPLATSPTGRWRTSIVGWYG